MKCLSAATLGVVLLAMAAGCVSQQKYDTLLAQNAEQKRKIDELGRDVDAARLAAASLRTQLKGEQDALAGERGRVSSLDSQIGVLTARGGQLELEVNRLVAEMNKPPAKPDVAGGQVSEVEPLPVPLPAAVADALETFAASAKSMTFDRATGRCRFASDALFDKGTDTVKAEFAAVLGRFAKIFTGVGAGCRLSVEGHTDSLRIRNTGTRSKHPTNWHLSAHRAIEVMRVLYKAGIDQDRFAVRGYGSHQPIADNKTAAGRARNRRVEVFVIAPAGGGRLAERPAPMGGE